jgi:hypothetical protein
MRSMVEGVLGAEVYVAADAPPTALTRGPPSPRAGRRSHMNAWMPVWARPRISVWMS